MKHSSTDAPKSQNPVRPPARAGSGLNERPHRPTQAVRALPFGPLGNQIPAIATAVLRTLGRTCRVVERRNEEYTATRVLGERKNIIFATWHNRLFYGLYYWSRWVYRHGTKFSLLISASKDGEMLARTIAYMGGDVVRGSSSRRGSEALLGLLDRLRRGYNCAVTPDGPRGPRYRAHAGVVLLAQKSGVPIIPISVGLKRALIFNSWDKFMLPWPMTQARILYGDPVFVPPDADDTIREHFRKKVEDDLNALTRDADDWDGWRRRS
ncbi:MAG: lysophospholipid acyltransferase family protein [Candidatus Brocadiae bacterium]|nr:lysophospholipid acyltransferase family protein [Candidatus Brocadiia bacterium]